MRVNSIRTPRSGATAAAGCHNEPARCSLPRTTTCPDCFLWVTWLQVNVPLQVCGKPAQVSASDWNRLSASRVAHFEVYDHHGRSSQC